MGELFVQQQNPEENLVHPFIDGIHADVQLAGGFLGGSRYLLLPVTDDPAIPKVLSDFHHHLILVFGHSPERYSRHFKRKGSGIALVRGFAAERNLGKIAFGCIGKAVFFREPDQLVLGDQRIVVLCLALTFFQGELGRSRQDHSGHQQEKKKGSYHSVLS